MVGCIGLYLGGCLLRDATTQATGRWRKGGLRMGASDDPQSPMAAAMEWVARIMGAAVVMILPGLAGQWVDSKLGTGWIVLVGFAFGISLSIYYLLAITRPRKEAGNRNLDKHSENQKDRGQ